MNASAADERPPAASAPPESGPPGDAQRHFMSMFPSGVAVVTATDGCGAPHGLTCTAMMSVSLEPPTLLVSLNHASGTLAALREGGRFAVNLLRARSERTAEIFAGRVADRFGATIWTPSVFTRQPLLVRDAFAFAGCTVHQAISVGDHELVVGRIREIEVADDIPLLYGMRRFARWPVQQR